MRYLVIRLLQYGRGNNDINSNEIILSSAIISIAEFN